MQRVAFLMVCSTLLIYPVCASADVKIGNIKVKDNGVIQFSDSSEQGTATLQGPPGAPGPQGIPGLQGPPGTPGSDVSKDLICQVYADNNLSAPPFCGKKTVFITSQKFDSNLGGLAGADAKCQAAADAALLQGTFKAWLSDATTDARDRLAHSPAP